MLPPHALSAGIATFAGVWCLFFSTLTPVLALKQAATRRECVLVATAKHRAPIRKVKTERRERATPGTPSFVVPLTVITAPPPAKRPTAKKPNPDAYVREL